MKFAFIEAERETFPVRLLCRTLGVSSSGYYRWLQTKGLPDLRYRDDEEDLRRDIIRIHRRSRCSYGRPRIHAELRKRGWRVGSQRIRRIMVEEGLRGRGRRGWRRTNDDAGEISENLLDRNFKVEKPNSVWTGDITYLELDGCFWYLAVVIDLFSRKVVGWHLTDHADTGIVVRALRDALDRRRPDPGALIFHSDQGTQYRSKRFRRILQIYGVGQSMSRRGNCWDNAPTESFFATLKVECIDRHIWTSPQELRAALDTYIDDFYNRRRSHSALGYQTPHHYETAA